MTILAGNLILDSKGHATIDDRTGIGINVNPTDIIIRDGT